MAISGAGSSDNDKKATNQASAAEREAQRRIAEATRNVRSAENESRQQIDDIKDEYVKQSATEQARQQAQLETERQKSYRAVRELQKATTTDQGRTRRQGERDLSDLKNHYRDSVYQTTQDSEQELARIKGSNTRAIDFENRTAKEELEQGQHEHQTQIQGARQEHEQKREALTTQQRKEFEELRDKTEVAREQSREHFEQRYQSLNHEQDETLNRLWDRASGEIRRTRESTAARLAAYSDRQADPFYKQMNLDTKLSENADEYILTARIPEHEREHVVVSVKGNNLVISGSRRNEEHLDHPDGSGQNTSSFQSYSESHPISWPVESKLITKTYSGDTLEVRVPKKDANHIVPQYQAPKPERVRAERPRYPDNIPYAHSPDSEKAQKELAEKNASTDGDRSTRRYDKTLG